jgi:hypothetical protein
MSMGPRGGPGLASWPTFVDQLAAAAGHGADPTDRGCETAEQLVLRADSAATRLRAEGRLAKVARDALGEPFSRAIPPQNEALARLSWPLVISTNYDDVYVVAASRQGLQGRKTSEEGDQERPVVLGRSAQDCRRVLRALRAPEHPIVWAVQGFLGGLVTPRSAYDRSPRLDEEIVVGHAEYRRTTHAEPYFRRAFAEVLRSRSLLFLGSSVERYLLDLLDEIIELHGPSPHPHFAIFGDPAEPKQHREAAARTHGIHPIFLKGHEDLPEFLDELFTSDVGSGVRRRAVGATASAGGCEIPVGPIPDRVSSAWRVAQDAPTLEVLRSGMLPAVAPGEWHIFSLGGFPGSPEIGTRGMALLRLPSKHVTNASWAPYRHAEFRGVLWGECSKDPECKAGPLGVYARLAPHEELAEELRPVRSDRAGDDPPHARDLRLVSRATETVLQEAARCGIHHVHTELIAGGSWRTFPAAYAFIEMVRGWAAWRNELGSGAETAPRFTIHLDPSHISDQAVLRELDSGRVVIESLLDSGQLTFWVDVPGFTGEHARTPVVAAPDATIWSVVESLFDLTRDDLEWKLGLEPIPCLDWEPWRVRDVVDWEKEQARMMDLRTFGVVPYSVVGISPPDPPNRLAKHGRQ